MEGMLFLTTDGEVKGGAIEIVNEFNLKVEDRGW